VLLSKGKRYTNEARFYLGQIAETNNNFAAALNWYEGINNTDQNYFDARINMVRILSRQGKTDDARDQLHSITTDTPQQTIRLMRVEGEILTDEGHYQDAMNLYNKALNDDRYDAEVLYARAMLAEKMGRFEILEKDLRHILEHEPDNIQALNALGYSLADRTDRYHEALALIKRALELSPNDYYILDSMGWVLYRLGRLDEAAEHLQRARELRNDPEVAAHLGEVLWVMGDQAGARKIWGTALQAKPDDKNLLEVIKKFAH
jgi:tetratricopeptide (TPR) repeat protein